MKKRWLFAVVCLFVVCVSGLFACGRTTEQEPYPSDTELYYRLSADGTYYIVLGAYEGITEITIPDTYRDLPVKAIAGAAFADNETLKRVTVTDSVTEIGNEAFRNCQQLETVTFGADSRLERIGQQAFYDCTRLAAVTIPGGVTHIGDSAFGNCAGLTAIDYNATGITELQEGSNVFFKAGNAAAGITVRFGDAVTQIPARLFCVDSADIYFESSPTPNIVRVEFGRSVTNIGDSAFDGCSRLSGILEIPDSVTKIGYRAFADCVNLMGVTVGSGAEYIGDDAFLGCRKLVEVRNRSSLTISAQGRENGGIGYYALHVVDAAEQSRLYSTADGYVFYVDGDIRYLLGYTGAAADITLPADCQGYGYAVYDCAFFDNIRLASAVIPAGVTAFGRDVFAGSFPVHLTVPFIGATKNGSDTACFGYLFGAETYEEHDIVPTSLKRVDVTGGAIGDRAFYGCWAIEEITVPDDVTRIGSGAFYNCGNLTAIVVPDSVTRIERYAFSGCRSLKRVTIGTGVTYIGEMAFYECEALEGVYIRDLAAWCGILFDRDGMYENSNPLPFAGNLYLNDELVTELVIPDGITEIQTSAFAGCRPLTSLVIPYGVKHIGGGAFAECTGLTEVTIPDSVTVLGGAFAGCTGLKKVTIPDSVTEIGWSAFAECTSLTEITIPDSVVSLGGYTFAGCTALTNATVGTGVTAILDSTFSGCAALTEVILPDSLTEIGSDSFFGCTALTEITMPDSVTSIGGSAFSGCTALTEIMLPDSLLYLGDWVFADCTALTGIALPGSVESVSDWAFSGCSALTSIALPGSVESVSDWAFNGCGALNSVTIPASVTSIGTGAFDFCDSLAAVYYEGDIAGWCGIEGLAELAAEGRTLYIGGQEIAGDVVIPEGVTRIAPYAFYGCDLTSVTIPDSVAEVGDHAFDGNVRLIVTSGGVRYADGWAVGCEPDVTEVVIRDGTGGIADGAFYGCKALASVTIPDSVTHISVYAFFDSGYYNDSSNWENGALYIGRHLIEVADTLSGMFAVKEGTLTIATYAFSGCRDLTGITIPASVTYISRDAFGTTSYGCTGLTGVYIDDLSAWCAISFGNMTANPLYFAHNLYISGSLATEAVIPDGVTAIGAHAFSVCAGITSVTIPASVTSIGNGAFAGGNLQTVYYEGDLAGWCGIQGLQGLMIKGIALYIDGQEVAGDVVIPTGVTGIAPYAFYDCAGITSVSLPAGVTSIGNGAFYGCNSLQTVFYEGDIGGWCGIQGLQGLMKRGITLCIDGQEVAGDVVIPTGVTGLAPYAFYDCAGITSVTIPVSVTNIGNGAFYGCNSLQTVFYEGDIGGWCGIQGLQGLMVKGITLYIDGQEVAGDVVIPAGVTGIAAYAFYECYLTSVTLPDGLTHIEIGVFQDCFRMENITLPDSIQRIESGAFFGCDGLIDIYYGGDMAGWCGIQGLEELMVQLYRDEPVSLYIDGQEVAGDVVIPDGVTGIGAYAFYGCAEITGVSIGRDVGSVGANAFGGCPNLASVTVAEGNATYHSAGNCLIKTDSRRLVFGAVACEIPADGSVTSIGEYAFYMRRDLTDIVLPDSVVRIEGNAFAGSSLASISLPDKLAYIGGNAFRGCDSLAFVTIGRGLADIGDGAFDECPSLTGFIVSADNDAFAASDGILYNKDKTQFAHVPMGLPGSIAIPDGMTKLEDYAFYNCGSVTGIYIPDSVTEIGERAFEGCGSLAYILVSENNEAYTAVDGILYTKDLTQFVHIPAALQGDIAIPDGITAIPRDAFFCRTALTGIVLPDSVTEIGANAFYGCTGITSVTIPAGVTTIGEFTFQTCTGLTEITVPDTVTSIGMYAFHGCTALADVTLGCGIQRIGNEAFAECTGLIGVYIGDLSAWCAISFGDATANPLYYAKNLYVNDCLVTAAVIPDGVTEVGAYAFYGCAGITSVTIPDSVTAIGDYCFGNCTSLDSVTIPGSVTSIGDGTFSRCTSLDSITIPADVTSIGDGTFSGCTSLDSITIPAGVTSIGDHAFSGCTSLKYVTLPAGLTQIGSDAFSECTALTGMQLPAGITNLENNTFYKCTSLTYAILPAGLTRIGSGVFYQCRSLGSIVIPQNVTSIGYAAFGQCYGLKDATFENPDGWWYAIDDAATSGTDIPGSLLSDPAQAASQLKSRSHYRWKRG